MPRDRSYPGLPLFGLRWRGLTVQLFALIVLPLTALLLLITFGSLTLHQRAMRNLVGERDERAARTAASALSEQLNHRAAAVRGMALRAADRVPLYEILESSDFLKPDFDGGLAFFSPQGRLLAAAGGSLNWDDLTGEAGEILVDYLAQANFPPVFSIPFLHPQQGDPIVFVVASASQNAPIAVGAFSPALLAGRVLAGAFTPGELVTAFLVAPGHKLLYQIGGFTSLEDLDAHPGVKEALRGESGATYLQVEGSEHVIAFSPVTPTGWALVIEEPWHAVASPLLNTTQLAPLILVPLLLLALVALWFGARQIIQPLQALEARAADLVWGDFQTIEEPVGGIEEIGRLHHTLIHLARKVQRSQQSLRSYIGAITTGQEEERHRLARELHDDTIQALIALNQRVQLARLTLAESAAAEHLDEIQTLTEQTIQNLRRLTRALRPLYLEDLGLVAALDMLARETSQTADIPIDFQRVGVERRLVPEEELALYRIAQESLSNVVRHAHAKHCSLNIHFTPQTITLTVADDGCGFEAPESPAEFAPGGHFGLLGLHERAELIGARLEIQSAPNQGTLITVSVPLPPTTLDP